MSATDEVTEARRLYEGMRHERDEALSLINWVEDTCKSVTDNHAAYDYDDWSRGVLYFAGTVKRILEK